MAVVSRIATLKFDNGLGSSRTWVATAANQDTDNGSSVVVTVTNTAAGGIPPGVSETFTLRYMTDANVAIKTVTLNNSAASQTDTFHFTDTGNSGGSNRHGTVEIRFRVTKTTGGPTATYDYETDGAPATPPSTFTATQVDRGWIRGGTTITPAVSNVSAGGAKSSPASFPDPLHVRLTTGSTSYNAVTYTAGLKESSTTKRTGSTNSTTQNWDVAFTGTSTTVGRVNDGLTASSHTLTTFATIPNASLTGSAYTYLTSAQTEDTITTDPRRTVTHLFQLDDNTFGTPPSSKHNAAGQRLTSEQAFMASRWTNARGEGTNLITWDVLLDPVAPGTNVTNTGITGATQGGEVGWSNAFTSWSSSLPGGTWNKSVTATAPADAVLAGHVVGSTAAYTLLAVNPNFRIVAGGGNSDSTKAARHFTAGDALVLAASMRDISTSEYADVDASPVPAVVLLRLNPALGRGEYLRSSDMTWVAAAGATADNFTMTQSAGDAGVWLKTFTAAQTAGWGDYDFILIPKMYNNGTPYAVASIVTVLGTHNQHDAASTSTGGAGAGSMSPWDVPIGNRKALTRLRDEIERVRVEVAGKPQVDIQSAVNPMIDKARAEVLVTVKHEISLIEGRHAKALEMYAELAREMEDIQAMLALTLSEPGS